MNMMSELSTKCVNCGEMFGRHHYVSNACPRHASGATREVWDQISRFEPVASSVGDNPAGAGLQESLGEIGVVKLKVGLPTDHATRKGIPIYTGFVKYFPRAMAAVAELSRISNEQHHPGAPVHWDKSKSGDELDCVMRHMIDDVLGVPVDTDQQLHATKVAWRAMANLERILEKQQP